MPDTSLNVPGGVDGATFEVIIFINPLPGLIYRLTYPVTIMVLKLLHDNTV